MTKILTVIGARPQFVKAAVLSRLVRTERYRDSIQEFLVHTGQHYDANMSEVFFSEMEIPAPDANLGIGSGNHGQMTGLMLMRLEELILENKPDILLVYGDTNSTMAGALAASKLHVPVAHVEAGLRSYMMEMPEEQNRRLTDNLASYLFCPTQTAIHNLEVEGIRPSEEGKPSADHKRVSMVGDIMLDASLHYRGKSSKAAETLVGGLPRPFCLLTIHRAENTDDLTRLRAIVEGINEASETNFVFPIHPRTRKVLEGNGLAFGKHVRLIDPVGYFEMLALENACSFVMTDSGGVQKEAYFFEKPCLTIRDSTEWVELVDAGWNTLVGAERAAIRTALGEVKAPVEHPLLYGRGEAAVAIADTLARSWK